LITLVVIASDQPDGRYSRLYVWVAVQACYFLSPRTGMLHMVSVAAQYTVALIVKRGGADQWVHPHHERPDGTGYPLGLSGSDVSLEARILAVADSYEAMTSNPSVPRCSAEASRVG
jgi:hypothetical protein